MGNVDMASEIMANYNTLVNEVTAVARATRFSDLTRDRNNIKIIDNATHVDTCVYYIPVAVRPLRNYIVP